jgi:hypothetical protein
MALLQGALRNWQQEYQCQQVALPNRLLPWQVWGSEGTSPAIAPIPLKRPVLWNSQTQPLLSTHVQAWTPINQIGTVIEATQKSDKPTYKYKNNMKKKQKP